MKESKEEIQTVLFQPKRAKKKRRKIHFNVDVEIRELDRRLDYALWKDEERDNLTNSHNPTTPNQDKPINR